MGGASLDEEIWGVLLLDDTPSHPQVLERDGKLGELDHRTDALQVQPSQEKSSNSKKCERVKAKPLVVTSV